MAARDVLKNFSLFVDGRGYAGQVTEYNPPELAIATEDHRAGGMDAPVALDMGMEGLESSFVLAQYSADVLALFGLVKGSAAQLTARGALESYDGAVKPALHQMRGRIVRVARGTWTPGSPAPLTFTLRLDYYREEIDRVTIHEIDVVNMIRIVNGTDQLAAQRAALGI